MIFSQVIEIRVVFINIWKQFGSAKVRAVRLLRLNLAPFFLNGVYYMFHIACLLPAFTVHLMASLGFFFHFRFFLYLQLYLQYTPVTFAIVSDKDL